MVTANRFAHKAKRDLVLMNFSRAAIIVLKGPYSKCTADCNEALSEDLVESCHIRSQGALLNYWTGGGGAFNGTTLVGLMTEPASTACASSRSRKPACSHSGALLPSAGEDAAWQGGPAAPTPPHPGRDRLSEAFLRDGHY